MPATTKSPSSGWIATAAAAAGVAAAFYNRHKTRQAEALTSPVGAFVEVDGVKVHYLRRGSGVPIVLLHGNGVMLQDWLVSGVFDELARTHDVIAFDRPGFGYSERRRNAIWTPQRQAGIIAGALETLDVAGAIVVGHSFGTQVALALALDHPHLVARLVLLSGYYFPTPRIDMLLSAGQAIPLVGDILCNTISPIASRAMLPVITKQLFAPAPVPLRWASEFPQEMMLRPAQIRATAADSGLVVPAAMALSLRYGELALPVTIVAGRGDKIVGYPGHSQRLHEALPGSRLVLIDDVGHMVHYSATDQVLDAISPSATAAEIAVAAQ